MNGNQQQGKCQFSFGGKWRLFFLKVRPGRGFTLLTCPFAMGRRVRLPKPATSQFPHESRSLREKWSLVIPNASTHPPSPRLRRDKRATHIQCCLPRQSLHATAGPGQPRGKQGFLVLTNPSLKPAGIRRRDVLQGRNGNARINETKNPFQIWPKAQR